MKLIELKEKVDKALEFGNEDLDVCIPNNKRSMAGTSTTKVKGVGSGFDWNRGKFFIFPEKDMIEK